MTDSTVRPLDTTAAVRPAAPDDWEYIERLLSTSALPLDGAREHLDGFLVAERGGQIVGCAAIERHANAGLLRSVAVEPSERGKGTGAALVERCIAGATERDVDTLVLLTTTADGYFPRFGFEIVDRSAVPDAVRESAEFRGACPDSATVMVRYAHPGMDRVTVRRGHRDDAAAIAAIYNAGIRGRMATFETRERSATEIAVWFESERPVLVAERGGRVVGWVAASAYRARDCYAGIAEFSVYVDTTEQGRRIGDKLMREFLPALEDAGYWKVLSRIFPENAASRALCRRHGFREVGFYERHARLDGVWRDVVIVERLLGDAARR